jgi:hypothetical protein
MATITQKQLDYIKALLGKVRGSHPDNMAELSKNEQVRTKLVLAGDYSKISKADASVVINELKWNTSGDAIFMTFLDRFGDDFVRAVFGDEVLNIDQTSQTEHEFNTRLAAFVEGEKIAKEQQEAFEEAVEREREFNEEILKEQVVEEYGFRPLFANGEKRYNLGNSDPYADSDHPNRTKWKPNDDFVYTLDEAYEIATGNNDEELQRIKADKKARQVFREKSQTRSVWGEPGGFITGELPANVKWQQVAEYRGLRRFVSEDGRYKYGTNANGEYTGTYFDREKPAEQPVKAKHPLPGDYFKLKQ